jgi:hypothetical protein
MAIEEYVVSLNLIINIIVGYEKRRRSSFWWDMLKEVKPFLQLRVAREVKSLRY